MTAPDYDVSSFFPGFETRRLSVDGVDIHYVVGGSGPPLLLVHGAPQSGIMWRRIAPALAERFTLIIPDLRGYGRSGKPARGDYSKRRMAADLIAVMDMLEYDRFYIAGHDRGARVTRRLIKDHPERIIRGAILDIVPTAHLYANMSRQAAINLWNWCIWAAPEPLPETIIDPAAQIALVNRALGGDPDPAAERDYLDTNGDAESLHAMCEDYRASASTDLEHDAADADRPIDVPLLVAWGSRSSRPRRSSMCARRGRMRAPTSSTGRSTADISWPRRNRPRRRRCCSTIFDKNGEREGHDHGTG